MRVRIQDSAHNDMREGYWFYENQMPGLGDYFSDTLYGEIESLALYAGIHNKRFGFYRALSRRFPYSIYYDIEDGEARVYGVLDNRRDPNWIYSHLRTGLTSAQVDNPDK
jgi:plasmid stabilization system protein ParE